jgi:hypothetical protein
LQNCYNDNMFRIKFPACVVLLTVFLSQAAEASAPGGWSALIGTNQGLFGVDEYGLGEMLWMEAGVRQVVSLGLNGYAMLTDKGVYTSADGREWESANTGLPQKTYKLYDNNVKQLVRETQNLEDLAVCPQNPDILVTATRTAVYLSHNGGLSWTSLGFPDWQTDGVKAVAAAMLPVVRAGKPRGGRTLTLTVFMAHSLYGIHYIQPDVAGSAWTQLSDGNNGMEDLESTDNNDETSDIAVADQEGKAVVYASQSFRPRLYRLNWEKQKFSLLWAGNGGRPGTGAEGFGVTDSIAASAKNQGLLFLSKDGIQEFSFETKLVMGRKDLELMLKPIIQQGYRPECMLAAGANSSFSLSEFWLLESKNADLGPEGNTARIAEAEGHRGLYLPVNRAIDSLDKYLELMRAHHLDMVVLDMKDDFGRLRFKPENPAIKVYGKVVAPLDIDTALAKFKVQGIYTVARIVTFKDPVMASRDGGKFAVWDRRANKAWRGYALGGAGAGAGGRQEKIYNDERWVDPYCEQVWEYVGNIAVELHRRGFDEIQFDYIRFPTDGVNLDDAEYRWKDKGMDKESAILSFLRYVRGRLSGVDDCPISIDVYGANAFYRTAARTGQDLETFSRYVDVICPMFYPSHFSQGFLANPPAVERPYRIYYAGTLRAGAITRGRVLIRPWAQAFYLNVSYDRKYYNTHYIELQLQGLKDAGSPGFCYWNNSGHYEDIP